MLRALHTCLKSIHPTSIVLESCSNFQHAALHPCFPEIVYSFSDLNYGQNKSRNRYKHLGMWFSRISVSREHSNDFYQPLAHSYVTALSLGSPRFKSILIHGNSNPILKVPNGDKHLERSHVNCLELLEQNRRKT